MKKIIHIIICFLIHYSIPKKIGIPFLFLIIWYSTFTIHSFAQTTFQKIYTTSLDAYCFGAYQTTDQGYIITGIANTSANTQKVFLTRTDCHGEILWSKVYSTSSTVGNISQ